jgi:hypothetical protein
VLTNHEIDMPFLNNTIIAAAIIPKLLKQMIANIKTTAVARILILLMSSDRKKTPMKIYPKTLVDAKTKSHRLMPIISSLTRVGVRSNISNVPVICSVRKFSANELIAVYK